MQRRWRSWRREPRRSRGRWTMRNWLLAVMICTVLLAACGGEAATSAPAPTTGPTPVTPAPTTAATSATPAALATTPTLTPARPRATAAAQPTASPMQESQIGYGMNVWLPTADKDRTLDLLTEAGFRWARQWISWESVEYTKGVYDWKVLDEVVAAAERHNVKLQIAFVRSPEWAGANHGIPQDKSLYANVLSAMAQRYKGRIAAYEIWNEANMAGETGGKVNAVEYVELLKAAYPAVKNADPEAVVVYGGLTPTGVNDPAIAIEDTVYLRQTYAYNNGEVKDYFDVMGVHTGGMNNPPEALWPENPGPGPGFFEHRSFYFRRVEDLRKIMEEHGDGAKQIWLTEFGWTTKNQARGYEYGQYISEQDQADYLVRAYQYARENYPWMGVMFMWNLNFSTVSQPEDEKTPWSIVNSDYSPRPAYEALKQMPKE